MCPQTLIICFVQSGKQTRYYYMDEINALKDIQQMTTCPLKEQPQMTHAHTRHWEETPGNITINYLWMIKKSQFLAFSYK